MQNKKTPEIELPEQLFKDAEKGPVFINTPFGVYIFRKVRAISPKIIKE